MQLNIKCSDPAHDERAEVEGWSEFLGVITLPDNATAAQIRNATSGYLCEICANWPPEEPEPETTPEGNQNS